MGIVEQLRRDAYAPHFTSGGAANLMIKAAREIERQGNEIKSLRASLGEYNGAEPVGCPIPGACACPVTNQT